MIRNVITVLAICSLFVAFGSCGSSSNIDTACGLLAGKIFDACDPATDAATIASTCEALDITECDTEMEAASITEADVKEVCVSNWEAQGGDELTDAQITQLQAALDLLPDDCATVAGAIIDIVNGLENP
jgi:hypothetical protein